jgi:hypothetical protein
MRGDMTTAIDKARYTEPRPFLLQRLLLVALKLLVFPFVVALELIYAVRGR